MSRSVQPQPSRPTRPRKIWILLGLLFGLLLPPPAAWLYFHTNGFVTLRPMSVRKATAADPPFTRFRLFGNVAPFANDTVTVRTVAVAEGPVSYGGPVTGNLFLVKNGTVTDAGFSVSGQTVGPRKPVLMKIRFYVIEADSDSSRLVALNVRGGPRSGGAPEVLLDFDSRYRQTFTGRIDIGETCLLYIEGDRQFLTRRDMTVQEFARTKPGNFLVLTITRN